MPRFARDSQVGTPLQLHEKSWWEEQPLSGDAASKSSVQCPQEAGIVSLADWLKQVLHSYNYFTRSSAMLTGERPDRVAKPVASPFSMPGLRSGSSDDEPTTPESSSTCSQPVSTPQPSASSIALDGLQPGEVIGAGGYGIVYKAVWHDQPVALKVVRHPTAALQQLLALRMRLMALHHPNVVQMMWMCTVQPNWRSRSLEITRYASIDSPHDIPSATGSPAAGRRHNDTTPVPAACATALFRSAACQPLPDTASPQEAKAAGVGCAAGAGAADTPAGSPHAAATAADLPLRQDCRPWLGLLDEARPALGSAQGKPCVVYGAPPALWRGWCSAPGRRSSGRACAPPRACSCRGRRGPSRAGK